MARGKQNTPLQEQKAKEVQETIDQLQATEQAQEQTSEASPSEPPKKRGRKPGLVNKAKEPVNPDTGNPETWKAEGEFIINFFGSVRPMMGVKEPIPEELKGNFVVSYVALCTKYNGIANKWMPEIMFGMSCLMLGVDTMKHMPKKVKKAEKVEDAKPVEAAALPITKGPEDTRPQ